MFATWPCTQAVCARFTWLWSHFGTPVSRHKALKRRGSQPALLAMSSQVYLNAGTPYPRSRCGTPPHRAHSTVRGAMVGIMLAGASLQHQDHPGAPSAPQLLPELVGEDAGGVRQAGCESSNDVVGDSAWSNALTAESAPAALPRDPSTCALWCAIALGALVRGAPLEHVRVKQHVLLSPHF